jgi:hypothetical protein
MKVRLLIDETLIGDTTRHRGEVVEVSEERAVDLVERGHAEWLDVPSRVLEGVAALKNKLSGPKG